ncbi:hypothetical protein GQX74_013379 [Glossina fuscipes]|nr:hypothetical protein GQX74_013379 [Glossina fuscipes]
MSSPSQNIETNITSRDEINDNNALIAAIVDLNLDERDDAIRQQILSSTADQRRALDLWTSELIASLAKPKRPAQVQAHLPQQTSNRKNKRAASYRKAQKEYIASKNF